MLLSAGLVAKVSLLCTFTNVTADIDENCEVGPSD